MPILNKIDLIMHIQKLQLHKDTLFVSPLLEEKQQSLLAELIDMEIQIYETALKMAN